MDTKDSISQAFDAKFSFGTAHFTVTIEGHSESQLDIGRAGLCNDIAVRIHEKVYHGVIQSLDYFNKTFEFDTGESSSEDSIQVGLFGYTLTLDYKLDFEADVPVDVFRFDIGGTFAEIVSGFVRDTSRRLYYEAVEASHGKFKQKELTDLEWAGVSDVEHLGTGSCN